MTDDPVDLSALDPSSDAARFRRMEAAIGARVARELARRRVPTVVMQLSGWSRSVLVAAAAICLFATLPLLSSEAGSRSRARPGAAGELTSTAVLWAAAAGGPMPTPLELFYTLEGPGDGHVQE